MQEQNTTVSRQPVLPDKFQRAVEYFSGINRVKKEAFFPCYVFNYGHGIVIGNAVTQIDAVRQKTKVFRLSFN